MPGLVISLRPKEKFLVNGALLSNGERRSQIHVEDDNVYVLRLSDALHPDNVDTPIKRVYFAVQTILSGDVKSEDGIDNVLKGLTDLALVFEDTSLEKPLNRAIKSAANKRFYSVLYALKPLFELEAKMLMPIGVGVAAPATEGSADAPLARAG